MATYAIGDIQGCFAPLQRLLQRIQFNPQQDRLWLAGDLVNRGPDSLGVLRWAQGLGDRVRLVLGNHDLRLLSIARGLRSARPNDTLDAVLSAPDCDSLMDWLQAQPLLLVGQEHAMVHAGIPPMWSVAEAMALSEEVGAELRGSTGNALLAHLSVEVPNSWSAVRGLDRSVFIMKALTYMRVCHSDGTLHLDFTGPPSAAPAGTLPWYAIPQRKSRDTRIVCGHWSALGLHTENNIRALDTGCVWGAQLTAYRLDDGALFSEPAAPPIS